MDYKSEVLQVLRVGKGFLRGFQRNQNMNQTLCECSGSCEI